MIYFSEKITLRTTYFTLEKAAVANENSVRDYFFSTCNQIFKIRSSKTFFQQNNYILILACQEHALYSVLKERHTCMQWDGNKSL